MPDRCLEDFQVGAVFEHWPGRTIAEADNTWFTLLTMNQHPVHFDAEFAAGTEFGKVLVNSCLTLSMVTGMSVADVSRGAIATLVLGSKLVHGIFPRKKLIGLKCELE